MAKAALGEMQLLVYRECPCGRWCATAENGLAPMCDACGGFYVPGGGRREGEPQFGNSFGESRRLRRLAFVGFLTLEMGAVKTVAKWQRLLGLTWAMEIDGEKEYGHYLERAEEPGRRLLATETKAASDEIIEAKKRYPRGRDIEEADKPA
jgi:hypothetical protein